MTERSLTITLQPDWKGALRAIAKVAQADSYQGEVLNFESPAHFFGRLTEKRWDIVRAAQGKGEWFWESGFNKHPINDLELIRDWNLRAVFGAFNAMKTRDGKPEYLAKYGATNHTDRDSPPPAHPEQPRLPIAYLPAHPFDQGNQPGQRDETQASGVWERRDERTMRNELGRQFACVENIDTQIDRVLRRLEAMGELDNTYIFYTADNGIAIGRHGIQGKQILYEHSWRVPFIARGPGIPPGTRAQGNLYLLDLLATVCDLAGIPTPATSEGLSFRTVLEGKQPAIRDTMYGVFCGGTRPGIRAVRHGDWKLIQYDVHGGRVRETQLFNLRENPDELVIQHHDPAVVALTGHRPLPHQVNLAADPRHASKLREMKDRLLAEMRRFEDPFRMWDQPGDNLPVPPEPAVAAAPATRRRKN